MFCRAKHGRTIGMLVPAIALLALAPLLGGMSIDLLYFFELVFCGFVLYELFTLRLSVEKTVVLTSAATLAVGLFIVLVYSSTTAASLGQLVSDYVRRNLEASLRLYASMGVPADTIRPIEDALDGIQYVLVRIVPALSVSATLFLSWASMLLARPLLRSYRLYYPDFGRLNLWKAPEPLVWSVIGFGLMLMIPERTVKLFGINGLLILMTVYFFQGIAIISFYFEKKKLSAAVADRFVQSHRPAANRSADRCGLGFFRHVVEFQETGGRKKITPPRLEHCVSGMPPTGRRHVIRFWRFK
jgi:uncharacterized protein YybS (DUF2232 family)